MDKHQTDTLRRLGDRLDCVYAPEPSSELLAIIEPLFFNEAEQAEEAAAASQPGEGSAR